jgi:hypothetical protein
MHLYLFSSLLSILPDPADVRKRMVTSFKKN